MTGLIGIGITTHNRRDIFDYCFTRWQQYLPAGAVLVIVDDASSTPCPDATYRFDVNVGAPRAKNKCLELLMSAGCEHLFLADDDIHPTADDWWLPYINSPEPHLYWARPRRRKLASTRTINGHIVTDWPSGAVLYMQRHVVETVGGYDADTFGAVGYDHANYSDRIHAYGLTTWRFADAAHTGHLFTGPVVETSVAADERSDERMSQAKRNREHLKDTAYHFPLDG
ncbi:hypothetical protein PP713_13995 [Mycobacterium sp. CSUR Q5927]|nr:hypothetical protein [Mycobacterium sp. CSUR Q5927]